MGRGESRRDYSVRVSLGLLIETLEALSVMLWPALPRKADAMRRQLGLASIRPAVGVDLWPLQSKRVATRSSPTLGTATRSFRPLTRTSRKRCSIACSRRAKGRARLCHLRCRASVGGARRGEVSYDQFAVIDLRVGLVTSAKRVPKKDKLLELEIDLGEDSPRTIIAGLALSFTPEQLAGQRVIVVANLAPREFGKGLVSHGMLLASGPSDKLVLATAPADALPGAKLK